MTARRHLRLRTWLLFGGVFLGIAAGIGVAVWESQAGRPLEIPFLEPGENEGAKAEPLPAPAIIGVGIALSAFVLWMTLGWMPCRCTHCGAFAVRLKYEPSTTGRPSRTSRYRCGRCNEPDPEAPVVISTRRRIYQ